MLDEENDIFYDVDCTTLRTDADPSWEASAPQGFEDPAIVFPPEQAYKLGPHSIAVGFLVSITQREDGEIRARSYGRAMVKPLPPQLMSWEGLVDTKGPVLPAEMKAGLMGRLWNRRPGAENEPRFVTSMDILGKMPRKWHEDGAALNYELDNLFAAGKEISTSQAWCLHE
jgi:hypothetical protein